MRLRDVTFEKLHVCRQPPKSVARKGLGFSVAGLGVIRVSRFRGSGVGDRSECAHC